MSELQLALIGAGIAAVAAVWGYNGWQERKHRQAAERLFKGEQSDVLLKDAAAVAESASAVAEPAEPLSSADGFNERVEPTLGMPETPVAAPVEPPAPAPVPEIANAGVSARNEAVASAVALEDVSPADPVADCIVHFRLSAPVPASGVWAAQSAWSAGISKPLMWLGRNPGDSAWRFVGTEAVGRYTDWIAALQLADRRGPLSDAEISQFCDGLGQLGSHLGTEIALPGRSETLLRAQQLDNFCASVDVQFGIHVVEASGGSFAGTKLRGVCEAAGLKLGSDGCYHSFNDSGSEEFLIANIGNERFTAEGIKSMATHGVTLTIDVPRVADGAAAFNRMITTAQQLARGLGGVLVDVQRAPLADAMIVGIRAKIVELQGQMKAAEMPAGGARAQKLFA